MSTDVDDNEKKVQIDVEKLAKIVSDQSNDLSFRSELLNYNSNLINEIIAHLQYLTNTNMAVVSHLISLTVLVPTNDSIKDELDDVLKEYNTTKSHHFTRDINNTHNDNN